MGLFEGWYEDANPKAAALATLCGVSVFLFAIRRLGAHKPYEGHLRHEALKTLKHRFYSSKDGSLMCYFGANLAQLKETLLVLRHGPQPPWFLRNPHVQFAPWLLQNYVHQASRLSVKFQRLWLPAADGRDRICLDVVPPLPVADPTASEATAANWNAPLVLILPGLRGHSLDIPGQTLVRRLAVRGFRVCVLHFRAHTPGANLKHPKVSLFGHDEDVEAALLFLNQCYQKQQLHVPPIYMIGVSMGTAPAVTAACKWDQLQQSHLAGVVLLCPGYDCMRCFANFGQPYESMLRQTSMHHFLQRPEVSSALESRTVAMLEKRSHTFQAFVDNVNSLCWSDDELIALLSEQVEMKAVATIYTLNRKICRDGLHKRGVCSAADYQKLSFEAQIQLKTELAYEVYNPVNIFDHPLAYKTPCLIVNPIDDPCCSFANICAQSQHDGRTYLDHLVSWDNIILAIPTTGSHLPSIDGMFPELVDGVMMLPSWTERACVDFLEALNRR